MSAAGALVAAVSVVRAAAGVYFHRKCTKTRPELSESFSTRWYRALISC